LALLVNEKEAQRGQKCAHRERRDKSCNNDERHLEKLPGRGTTGKPRCQRRKSGGKNFEDISEQSGVLGYLENEGLVRSRCKREDQGIARLNAIVEAWEGDEKKHVSEMQEREAPTAQGREQP